MWVFTPIKKKNEAETSFNSIVLGIISSKKEIKESHDKHQLLPREKEKLCNPWNNVEIYFRNYQGEVKMT